MRGVQVKLWDPLRMFAIPERLRGVHDKAPKKSIFTFHTRAGGNPSSILYQNFHNMYCIYLVMSASVWRKKVIMVMASR